MLLKTFLFTPAKLFTLQLYEFAGFLMQCNSMFVIVSYSRIFWLVTHSSPINHKGGHVFHQIQNTVCLLKTTVHSVYMYLPANVLLYGEQEEGTDKRTFLEPRFTDACFELLQTIIFSQQKAHTFFSSISLLYGQIQWTLSLTRVTLAPIKI